ncbi:hypothetical protein P4O66_000299 [Electrophorus voltai]|uniref:Ephrin RBD domain-containing protein n=1 Tax=Electrophorus voltai TaxID=2609070 RepID=A0AAD9E0Y7_9TELE|nr:hypothetical protein P4O66_000299 [Electrophorus voltai]
MGVAEGGATSDGTKQGLDSVRGGVCATRGMKVVLKVGQTAYGLPPKARPGPGHSSTWTPGKGGDSSSSEGVDGTGAADGRGGGTLPASNVALIAGGAGGAAFLLLVAAVIGAVCYRRKKAKQSESHHPPLSLSSLTPKRGGATGGVVAAPTGVNSGGAEPSDIIIPLRTSDSTYCPHYEKVSGEYGHPVYIVQEMAPQSPANIYYKDIGHFYSTYPVFLRRISDIPTLRIPYFYSGYRTFLLYVSRISTLDIRHFYSTYSVFLLYDNEAEPSRRDWFQSTGGAAVNDLPPTDESLVGGTRRPKLLGDLRVWDTVWVEKI